MNGDSVLRQPLIESSENETEIMAVKRFIGANSQGYNSR
jgi:hypothetical protein